MERNSVKARRGEKDRIAIPSMDRLLWLDLCMRIKESREESWAHLFKVKAS